MTSAAQNHRRSGCATRLVIAGIVAAVVVVFVPVVALAATGWSIVPSPNSGTDDNQLFGVACVSDSDCWSVGGHFSGSSPVTTLFERWDGSAWNIVPSPPNVSTGDNDLYSVTCASPSECWAVGGYSNGTNFQTLIEKWDGTSWTTATSTNASTGDNALNGVTCSSASDCWAVGYSKSGTLNQTLVERWNGASWATVGSPNQGTGNNALDGVSCALATDCWAVGHYNNGSAEQTLSENWNGSAWSVVLPLNSGASTNVLGSVTCASPTECWAAGYFNNGTNDQTLIELWNGSAWSITPSQNNGPSEDNQFFGVTCASATECWAAGTFFNGTNNQTLIEGWDGTAWTIAPSQNQGPSEDNVLLGGVTCTPASECWAVGFYNNGTNFQTLIEEFTPPPSPQIPDAPWAVLLPISGAVALATRRLLARLRNG